MASTPTPSPNFQRTKSSPETDFETHPAPGSPSLGISRTLWIQYVHTWCYGFKKLRTHTLGTNSFHFIAGTLLGFLDLSSFQISLLSNGDKLYRVASRRSWNTVGNLSKLLAGSQMSSRHRSSPRYWLRSPFKISQTLHVTYWPPGVRYLGRNQGARLSALHSVCTPASMACEVSGPLLCRSPTAFALPDLKCLFAWGQSPFSSVFLITRYSGSGKDPLPSLPPACRMELKAFVLQDLLPCWLPRPIPSAHPSLNVI